MHNQRRDINVLYKKAILIYEKNGYKSKNYPKLKLDKRYRATLGTYNFDLNEIRINYYFNNYCSNRVVMNVLLHELGHFFSDSIYGNDFTEGGHHKNWRKIINKINNNTIYTIRDEVPTSRLKGLY